MQMSIWGALGFIALGVVIDRTYAILEWRKYYEGKRARGAYDERKKARI